MDIHTNKSYDRPNNKEAEVVKLFTVPQKQIDKAKRINTVTEVSKKKKRSALEISDAIGIYGAFGRTLSDLHKQGR